MGVKESELTTSGQSRYSKARACHDCFLAEEILRIGRHSENHHQIKTAFREQAQKTLSSCLSVYVFD